MDSDIKPLIDYLLSRKEDLFYWSNEEDYAFAIRNEKIFFDFDPELTLEDKRAAAEAILPLLPERVRERGLASTGKLQPRKQIDRQTSEPYHFTIIYQELGGSRQLHIQPAGDTEGEPVVININQFGLVALQKAFGFDEDLVARQIQFKK